MAEGAAGLTDEVAEKVGALEDATRNIVAALQIIADIADQSNLLALNATIEAARAGEAGKGFAVVAGEVKSLANQTAKATKEIGEYVASIEQATSLTVASIRRITEQVGTLNQANVAVSAAVEEQAAATGEIARNIEQAAQGTGEVTSNIVDVTRAAQETGGAAAEVNEAARELSKQSEMLRGVVDDFLQRVRQVV